MNKQKFLVFFILIISIIMMLALNNGHLLSLSAEVPPTLRQVNAPHLGDGPNIQPAIFWFGQVTPTSNYADARVSYDDEAVYLSIHIFDRLLWYDETPADDDLQNWDSVTLLLDVNQDVNSGPTENSFRFVGQLNHFQARNNYQSAFLWNGSDWTNTDLLFETKTGWRGSGLNGSQEARGWWITFTVPFESLNVEDHPSKGTVWRLAISLHDRDDAAGTPIPKQVWPERAVAVSPNTWGLLHFGIPSYQASFFVPKEIITLRNGLNDIKVTDAHVGGHSTCGAIYHPDYFDGWGDANYAGYEQISIQNQWDVADWPCFSKYYVTFPMETVPPGFDIIAASLSMTMFGNAGDNLAETPPNSYIQALTVGMSWDESTLSWNNAPMAIENITGTWVKPTQSSNQREYFWDVTRAVVEAHANNTPVRLALYSADNGYHSGKYFWSSDVGEWGATMRPTLEIVFGIPCDSPEIDCNYGYLPLIND